MSEWLKELPWKGSIRVTVSRVRISSSLQNDPKFKTLGIFLWTKLKVYFRAQEHEKDQLSEERMKECVLSYSQKRVHVIISSSLQNHPKLKTLGIFFMACVGTGRDLSLLFNVIQLQLTYFPFFNFLRYASRFLPTILRRRLR